MSRYLIWSIEHNGWWRHSCVGYTESKSEAGVYSEDEAFEIVKRSNEFSGDKPDEALVPVFDETKE